jgi:hypothetical protein
MKGKPTPETIAKQLAQLYEDYYQHEIFNIKAELELMVYSEILKVDPSAITLDMGILDRELTALNIELFGLAWLDYNYELCEEGKQDSSQSDVALCTEIMFAKSYLQKTKRSDTWSAAGFYNRTILEAGIAQKTSMDWSIPRDIPSYYERGVNSFPEESQKLFLRGFREHFDNKLLSDKECASRVANRLQSVPSWRDGIMIPQKLSSSFAQRIGFSPNTEALLLLQRLTVGLYRNARNYINALNDYGSWELARKSAHDLRTALLEAGRELLEKQNRSDMSKPSSV